ncbi:hypothetical protein I79_011941 [Cricetulus griseus]|uniref:Uncharacterized protein n=1 Tax=Cricetulus griseus TaxID=10029 RepID=G3HMH8_CRIGR|nr:hypothetical protein I79_011941 [Cricetulus griseus]
MLESLAQQGQKSQRFSFLLPNTELIRFVPHHEMDIFSFSYLKYVAIFCAA